MKIARSVAPFYDFASKLGIDPQLVIDQLTAGGQAVCEGKTVTITSADHVIVGNVPFGYGRYAARWASDFNARVRQYARERAGNSRAEAGQRTSPVLR
jgi:hypothetical protein